MLHRPKLSPAARREALTFYLCISPWLIGVTVFVIGPMIASLFLSFTDWDLFSAPVFSGARNYQQLAQDPLIWQSLKVTITYTALYVPTELIGGLLLAILMNQQIRGIRFFRAVFYLPSVLSGVAYVIVWMWLLHPQAGLINTVLRWFGIEGPRWLLDPRTALMARPGCKSSGVSPFHCFRRPFSSTLCSVSSPPSRRSRAPLWQQAEPALRWIRRCFS
jgi:multiple sugar transport system permease protein